MNLRLAIFCFLLSAFAASALQSPRAASNGTTVPMTTAVATNAPAAPKVMTLFLEPGGRIEATDDLSGKWMETTLPARIPVTVTNEGGQKFYRWVLPRQAWLSWQPVTNNEVTYRLFLGKEPRAYSRVIETAQPPVFTELPWKPTYAVVTVKRGEEESDFSVEAKL